MSTLSTISSMKVAGERRRGFTSCAVAAGWSHGGVVAPSSYILNQPKLQEDSTGVASEGVGTL